MRLEPGQLVRTGRRMSAEALLDRPDDGFHYELARGELVKMTPTGGKHGMVANSIGALLRAYAHPKRLGVVGTSEAGFVLSPHPETVRAPDVSFVARERIPAEGVPDGFWPFAPDLAVEVVSPSDRIDEMQAKVLEYLEAGTRLVWLAHPRTRTVAVWRLEGAPRAATARGRRTAGRRAQRLRPVVRVLAEDEVLSGGEVLPGFRCSVAELFG